MLTISEPVTAGSVEPHSYTPHIPHMHSPSSRHPEEMRRPLLPPGLGPPTRSVSRKSDFPRFGIARPSHTTDSGPPRSSLSPRLWLRRLSGTESTAFC